MRFCVAPALCTKKASVEELAILPIILPEWNVLNGFALTSKEAAKLRISQRYFAEKTFRQSQPCP